MKIAGADEVAVSYDPVEIIASVKADVVPMNRVRERAEMFEERVGDRTRRVFEYFGLASRQLDPIP